jgi:CheY-like chemotaxis protein
VLLIIEDDPKFAKVVANYAHKKSFKYLLASDGKTGLQLAQTHLVDAIILDLNLPDISGWEVLNVLKDNFNTRHIPVHIMSVTDADLDAYKRGAMGFLSKPVNQAGLEGSFQQIEEFIARKIKSLLLVEDDTNLRKSVRKLLEGNDVIITEAGLGQTALEQLANQHFDCMILDLNLPDMSGFELLNRLDGDEGLPKCPVIVYSGKALSEEENRELLKYADSVIVKGVKSPERLLDETALFLHRVIANLPEEKQQTIKRLHDSETVLAGKAILIVDDDARNAFALSKLLAGKDLNVYIAPNGQRALELLDKKQIDLILMDIMMPGMDGYETTRQVRAQPKFHRLPVLALTAKAMKGDREKCITAGANDYLSKPVDPDRLFSMLRVWLSRE